MNRFKQLPLSIALGVIVATVTAGGFAAASVDSSTKAGAAPADSVVVPKVEVARQRAMVFAAAGRNALALVDAAQRALAQDQPEQAREHLRRAAAILAQLKSGIEPGASDLIPIYAQLGILEGTEISEQQLDALRDHIVMGKHQQVVSGLESLGIGVVYRYVDMPVTGTLDEVKTAVEAMGRRADRLRAVKIVAGDFIKRRRGDRLGLILFGGQAYLQAPMTFDRDTAATLLQESAIGLAGKQTALGDAIGLAVKRLREQTEGNRLLVLLTDGANTAGNVDPLKAARLAAGERIRIYSIGIGTPSNGNPMTGGDLDERTLARIAETTGGRYFRGRDSAALQNIYQILDQLEPLSEDSMTMRPVVEVYWWPLAAAVALTMLMALLTMRLPKSLSGPEISRDF